MLPKWWKHYLSTLLCCKGQHIKTLSLELWGLYQWKPKENPAHSIFKNWQIKRIQLGENLWIYETFPWIAQCFALLEQKNIMQKCFDLHNIIFSHQNTWFLSNPSRWCRIRPVRFKTVPSPLNSFSKQVIDTFSLKYQWKLRKIS